MTFHEPQKAFYKDSNHRVVFRLFFFFLLFIAFSNFTAYRQTSATIVLSLTLQDLVQQADIIVLGRCAEMTSAWGTERKRIFTYVTVVPEQCLKGVECPSNILLRLLGGTVNNVAMTIAGTPTFHEDERVILFLKISSPSFYRVLGLSQGKFSVIQRRNISYVTRDMTGLTLAKKGDGEFHLEHPQELEREVDLETFISTIESYVLEEK